MKTLTFQLSDGEYEQLVQLLKADGCSIQEFFEAYTKQQVEIFAKRDQK